MAMVAVWRCCVSTSGNPALVLLAMLADGATMPSLTARGWRSVTELARRERALPALGEVLERHGQGQMPSGLAVYLQRSGSDVPATAVALGAVAANRDRTRDLIAQLTTIRAALAGAGIAVAPLKGAAVLERFGPVAREMTDLDLLVLEGSVDAARSVVLSLGYRDVTDEEYRSATLMPDDHQLLPLMLDGHPGSVELHRSPLQSEFDDHFSLSDARRHLVATGDGPWLTPLGLAIHSIAHSRVVDQGYRRRDLSVRSVLDLAMLADEEPDLPLELRRYSEQCPALMKRGIGAHLLLLGLIRERHRTGRADPRIRFWWWQVRILHRMPKVHRHVRYLVMIPFAMDRDRIEARAGRRLGVVALLVHRLRFLFGRATRYAREGR